MDYEIKTYQEEFLEDQVRIGMSMYDYWPMGGQTRIDQLKAQYSQDGFDPETRFYAFAGDKMVGFLTASFSQERDGKKVFFFEAPYVLPEYAPSVEDLLMKHAMKALKDNGADILQLRAGEYWGKSQYYAEKYGFSRTQDIARRAEIDLKTVDASKFPEPLHIEEFNPNVHYQPLIDYVTNRYNVPEERAKSLVDRWKDLKEGDQTKSPWDEVQTMLGYYVSTDQGKVVARGLCLNQANYGQNTCNASVIEVTTGYEHLRGEFLSTMIRKGIQHNKDTLVVHSGLWAGAKDEDYTPFGLEFKMKLAYYEKEL